MTTTASANLGRSQRSAVLFVVGAESRYFPLGPFTTVGRDTSSTIVLCDPLVSRRHIEIQQISDGRFRLRHVGKSNGTFVDGKEVTEVVLCHGNEIVIGGSRLRFEDHASSRIGVERIRVEASSQQAGHRERMLIDPNPTFLPSTAISDIDNLRQDYDKLRLAYQASRDIGSIRDVDTLLQRVLDQAFSSFVADRAVILLADPTTGKLEPRAAKTRSDHPGEFILSATILEEVVAHQVALLVTDVLQDSRFNTKESLAAEGVRSTMCVPLLYGELIGVMQLDSQRPENRFSQKDVDLLTTIANQAALSIKNARSYEQLIDVLCQRQEQERLVATGQLAAGVAHEVNNPLSYVLHNLSYAAGEIAARGDADFHDVVEALDDAHEGVERIRLIVRDLMTFSRADSDEKHVIDVQTVLDSCAKMAAFQIGRKARLVKDYRSVPLVYANKGRLGQVFLNLLINAAQAVPEQQSQQNEIRITTDADPAGNALVIVSDNGHGIPPEILCKVFDPFFTTKPVGVGTGLGLAVCRNLVTAAGGHITIDSEVSRGTAVKVTLPASSSQPQPGFLPAQASEQGVAGKKLQILLVDNDPRVLRSLCRCLGDHEVTVADGGQAAVKIIEGGRDFDAIFCDLLMPEMSGIDVYKQVQKLRPGLAERFVFVTSGASTRRGRELLGNVTNLCVEKPFDPGNIVAVVEQLTRAGQVAG